MRRIVLNFLVLENEYLLSWPISPIVNRYFIQYSISFNIYKGIKTPFTQRIGKRSAVAFVTSPLAGIKVGLKKHTIEDGIDLG